MIDSEWQSIHCNQLPQYNDSELLNKVLTKLKNLPPLITAPDIERLLEAISLCQQGKAFIFQAGDCAESFDDCNPRIINNKIEFLNEASNLLQSSLKLPIVTIGRIAGQFTKPRTLHMETQGNITLPSYRGDLINSANFDSNARLHDPARMLEGYNHSKNVLKYIPNNIFTSHEALNLYYESALTRQYQGKWYNLSGHLQWLGARTALPDSAQVAYLKSIINPIGIKVSAELYPNDLLEIIKTLNPNNLAGKILLITRLGHENVAHKLPQLIKIIHQHNLKVAWLSDPMHGNTELCNNLKTRHFDKIFSELKQTMHILKQHNSHLAGIHLECTADDVTECLGGTSQITPTKLPKAYYTLVDPRLNKSQTFELINNFKDLL